MNNEDPQTVFLRDYFAAQALSGFIAGGFTVTAMRQFDGDKRVVMREMSDTAYEWADAMMEARKRP